ncbi:pyridoxal phosphate-dependent aminotransferase [Lutimaribacter marinistellae]|uniref:histidinol-phosphate transaminase n=1 Tax=Lutimaribacter marinistellae TaxID=1820329 RepID=A0ABV7TLP5_9RHOB
MTQPRYTQIVQSLPATVPFVGPETQIRARGEPFKARIGANESVFGPSPRAIEAMRDAASEVWMYGDAESYDLKQELSARHGVTPAHIVVGSGIDGLLGSLVRLVVEPGDTVVTSDGAYPTFNYHVAGFGGVLHKVPYVEDREDPATLFAKAAEVGAKLVYLANPDNPMGSWHRGEEIVAALDKLPDGALLVLDEAYVECAPEGTAAPVDVDDPRVIRMRTFSKVYGMAGARIGYALAAPELISSFNKVRDHFGVNRIAQAGALAALRDTAYLDEVRGKIAASRERLAAIARENGLEPLPSATNFVAIDCGRDGAFAKAVLDGLIARSIFVRMPFAAPQNRCIRVSCGTEADMAAFAAAFPGALDDARTDQPE